MEQPESLTVTKTVPEGLTRSTVYAQDPYGNIWVTRMIDGVEGEWQLHMKAKDVVWPTLSFEQMLELGRKQQERQKSSSHDV